MEILLAIVGVAVLFPYVAGPVLLWLGGSRLPPTVMEAADPAVHLPSKAESLFWKTTHFFSSNGFQQLGERVRESASNGMSAFKQVWRNAETGEVALVGAFLNEKDDTFCNTFVAFMHDRGNGSMVITSNFDPGARTLLDPPGTSKVAVATQDVAELRVLHSAHLAIHGNQNARPLRVRDGFALCSQLDSASREHALKTKRFRSEGDTLRITMWGALFGIWINLPPFKNMLERQEHRLLEQVQAARPFTSAIDTRSRAA